MSTIVVTGASAGIGLESALQLGADGHHLVLVGRHEVRLADAAEAVRAAGAIHVDTFTADFASLDSVRTLGRDLLERLERIDVLVDNAGTVFARRTVTDDGLEATFAVNHLAGFLLTELLKERLIVLGARADRDHLVGGALQRRTWTSTTSVTSTGTRSCARTRAPSSPTCCTPGRSRPSWPRFGVTVNAVHPGSVATDIWSGAPWYARPFLAVAKRRMLSPEEGGRALDVPRGLAGRRGRDGGVLRPLRAATPVRARPGRRARPPAARGERAAGRAARQLTGQRSSSTGRRG